MKALAPTLIALLAATALALPAQEQQEAGDDRRGYTDTPRIPGQRWRVHDAERPRPPKVKPGEPLLNEAPPADAIVLFDGKDLSKWEARPGRRNPNPGPARWKVANGYMEVAASAGGIRTKEKFGDIQLHIEWMIPEGVEGAGQGRGNSGVEIMQRYEIQVLESFENVTYADGQAASIYGQWPPLVNASRPQGQWNVYDIFFEAPKFEGDKLTKPAFVTVVHNGIMVHHRQQIIGAAVHRRVGTYSPHGAEEPLSLQDHGQLVRYRNIWVRKLKPYDVP